MMSALSMVALFAIVVFLGGAAFGMLVLFVVSIHRTGRAPLSKVHRQRAGSISRRLLIGVRTNGEEDGK
jgi:hypothetical protein